MSSMEKTAAIILAIAMLVTCIVLTSSTDEVSADSEISSTNIADYVGDYWYETVSSSTDDSMAEYRLGLTIEANGSGGYQLVTYPQVTESRTYGLATSGTVNGGTITFEVSSDNPDQTISPLEFYTGVNRSCDLHTEFDHITTQDEPQSKHKAFFRAGDSPFFDAETSAGFTPYYYQTAFKLDADYVSLSFGAGSITIPSPSTFTGGSLTITGTPGETVVTGDVQLNGSTRGTSTMTLDGLTFTETGTIQFGTFSDITITNCVFQGWELVVSYAQTSGGPDRATPGTITIDSCTFEDGPNNRYAITATNKNIVLTNNHVDNFGRGANMNLTGDNGTVTVTGNDINNLTDRTDPYDSIAFQLAANLDGCSANISDNDINDAYVALAIYNGISGTPESVSMTGNRITNTPVGVLYKESAEHQISSQVIVEADGNYFAPTGGVGIPMTSEAQNGQSTSGIFIEDSYYVSEDGSSPLPPIDWDDDDDYVPIPPIVYDDSGDDDTVTIVACAAAAVVAVFMAVFLIVERRK